jgi:hypothetical protein
LIKDQQFYIGIYFVYFDSQTKIRFEHIKTNGKIHEKKDSGFLDSRLGIASDEPDSTSFLFSMNYVFTDL